MRAAHNLGPVNLALLRSFFSIVENGSLNRAAEHLRVSQSTLTRQVHALEEEVGGRIFERSASGVALTSAGHVLFDSMRPVLTQFDAALDDARKSARGQSARLRVGYLGSAAAQYLHPALAALRRTHAEVKVSLVDLSPGELIAALRKGTIDLALLANARTLLSREFFVRAIAVVPVFVALPDTHPLAAQSSVKLTDLRHEVFIGVNERDMPGHNQWIVQLCRRAHYRPKFVVQAESLAHGLATIVAEGAVDLLPEYATKTRVPDVVYRPLKDAAASCELLVAWQRGKLAEPVRAMLETLPAVRPTTQGIAGHRREPIRRNLI
ncbi:MAG: LysR family transcriptional regulator [Opitutus sp.]